MSKRGSRRVCTIYWLSKLGTEYEISMIEIVPARMGKGQELTRLSEKITYQRQYMVLERTLVESGDLHRIL